MIKHRILLGMYADWASEPSASAVRSFGLGSPRASDYALAIPCVRQFALCSEAKTGHMLCWAHDRA